MRGLAIVSSMVALTLAAGLLGCASPPVPAPAPVDGHNSRNSLSWAGAYEGVLPCADCPGIQTWLTLRRDGSYEMKTQRLGGAKAPRSALGKFTWNDAGGAVTLDGAGDGRQFRVGEGHLLLLDRNGMPPPSTEPSRRLTQVRVD